MCVFYTQGSHRSGEKFSSTSSKTFVESDVKPITLALLKRSEKVKYRIESDALPSCLPTDFNEICHK